jgi:hypothetical protein
MFQSSRKGLQQSSTSSLPQIDEDKTNTPTSIDSSTKAVAGGWKKLVDVFNMSDTSLDHSSDSGGDDMHNSLSSGMSAFTNSIMSTAASTTSSSASKKKEFKKSNMERWSQNQAMNLQTGSSTRWTDNDIKGHPQDCWD